MGNTALAPRDVDGAIVVASDLNRVEFDIQIATAHNFPRDTKKAIAQMRDMALSNREVAEDCFYALERKGKPIEGPGIRLAEIAALSWGNLRYGAQVIGEDEERRNVIAEAFCHDLESNVRLAVRVKRRITDKRGERYSEDMITVTGNAACSIALRNAILKIVPRVYVDEIYRAAKQMAVGDVKSINARCHDVLDRFSKMGISSDRVLAKAGVAGVEQITPKILEKLIGFGTALREGADADELFPRVAGNGASEKPLEPQKQTLAEKVQKRAAAAPQPQHRPPQQPPQEAMPWDEEMPDRTRQHGQVTRASKHQRGAA